MTKGPVYKRRGRSCSSIQAYAFDKLKAGESLIVTKLPGETEYRLSGGTKIPAGTFEALTLFGWIKPADDGLLPGVTQTWVIDHGLR